MATAAQVVNRAANDLGLLRLGQALSAANGVRIETAYDEIYAQLKTDGLATWASRANNGRVPDEIVPFVAIMVANNCLNTYGVSAERYNRIKSEFATAERDIRAYVTPMYKATDDPADF